VGTSTGSSNPGTSNTIGTKGTQYGTGTSQSGSTITINAIKVNKGGTNHNVTTGKVNVGGTWKTVIS
jgi:hypothetical protein